MNSKMCATTNIKGWKDIDFDVATEYVKKLQMRIVKAKQEGKQGKVKALQRLLTTSFYARVLAIKRVTENKGKKTAGVDGEIWSTDKLKLDAISKLKRRGYNPKPLKRIYIPKKNGKKRPLSIPTMLDRAMQTLYKFALEPIAEVGADPNSYGFRAKRCPQDAIEQCFIVLARDNSAEWVLEGDIKGCFDNISHEWIMKHIPMDKEILRKWLKSGFIETKELFPTKSGTPQGSPISPTISIMVLDGIETILKKKFKPYYIKGKEIAYKVNIVKFADDFIITGRSKELLENEVMPIVKEFLKERGLELSDEKTLITHIDEGFDFLGSNIRKYNGKLLVKPSKSSIKSVLAKVRKIIKNNKMATQEELIERLNPIIRGWVNFHRHNVSKQTFRYIDYKVFEALWTWCKRRHNHKSRYWIKERYFHLVGRRNWTFSYLENDSNVGKKYKQLYYASDRHITRFTKIKIMANPFDQEWEMYFEEREVGKLRNELKGRQTLEIIYRHQKGLCLKCGEKLTSETNFCIHFDRVSKRKIMLHPYCHEMLHKEVTNLVCRSS